MVNYWKCTKVELQAFAAARKITVMSSELGKEPSKIDYYHALVDEDARPSKPFDFLELSPENRNNVYRHLLVLENSWTCSPAILATCKQVNEEASSILYGDNLIEVRLRDRNVQAHGKSCGLTEEPTGWQQDGALKWPGFLRRAQWLQFSVAKWRWHTHSRERVQYILYSLCSFLARGHRLRSFELDIQDLHLAPTDPEYAQVTYPLQKLRALKRLVVRVAKNSALHGTHATSGADGFKNVMPVARAVYNLADEYLQFHDAVPRAHFNTNKFGRPLDVSSIRWSYNRMQDICNDYGRSFLDASWEKKVAEATAELRSALDDHRVSDYLQGRRNSEAPLGWGERLRKCQKKLDQVDRSSRAAPRARRATRERLRIKQAQAQQGASDRLVMKKSLKRKIDDMDSGELKEDVTNEHTTIVKSEIHSLKEKAEADAEGAEVRKAKEGEAEGGEAEDVMSIS